MKCECIQNARDYLSKAQSFNETEGMESQAFFTMGCAVAALINHADDEHDSISEATDIEAAL